MVMSLMLHMLPFYSPLSCKESEASASWVQIFSGKNLSVKTTCIITLYFLGINSCFLLCLLCWKLNWSVKILGDSGHSWWKQLNHLIYKESFIIILPLLYKLEAFYIHKKKKKKLTAGIKICFNSLWLLHNI